MTWVGKTNPRSLAVRRRRKVQNEPTAPRAQHNCWRRQRLWHRTRRKPALRSEAPRIRRALAVATTAAAAAGIERAGAASVVAEAAGAGGELRVVVRGGAVVEQAAATGVRGGRAAVAGLIVVAHAVLQPS